MLIYWYCLSQQNEVRLPKLTRSMLYLLGVRGISHTLEYKGPSYCWMQIPETQDSLA